MTDRPDLRKNFSHARKFRQEGIAKMQRKLSIAAITLAALASAGPASAQPMPYGNGPTAYAYALNPLAPFACRPNAINDAGQVVGYFDLNPQGTHYVAFTTGPNGHGVTGLRLDDEHDSSAFGINAAGQVVGYSYVAGTVYRAFVTDEGGKNMRTMGPPFGIAADINDAGQVAGSVFVDGAFRGFFTGPKGQGFTLLGTLGGSSSSASFINASGQIAGFSGVAGDSPLGMTHAFVTGPGGSGMTDLGLPDSIYSSVQGLNDQGQVSGTQRFSELDRQAYVTGSNGIGITLLGSLGNQPGGLSEGGGINNRGIVVGDSSRGTNYSHIYVTVTGPDGRMRKLDKSIANLPAGAYLRGNAVINNVGQIAATGSDGQCYIVCPNKDCQKPAN